MTLNDFGIGDTVRLNSGGPDMTVKGKTDAELLCNWFYTDGTIGTSFFSPLIVVLVKKAKP